MLFNLFRKKPKPADWTREKKIAALFWRATSDTHSSQFSRALFAIKDVAEPIIIIEYIDRMAAEIIVMGGDDAKVAEAIFNTRPMGLLLLGNTRVAHHFRGMTYLTPFTRPSGLYAVTP